MMLSRPIPTRFFGPLLGLIVFASAPVQSQQQSLKTFESQQYRFTVQYPADWRIEGPKRFVIYNFPQSRAVRGLVIPPGGAGIYVLVPPELTRGRAEPANLNDWVTLGSEHKKINGRRTLRLDRSRRIIAVVETTSSCCGALPPDLEMIEWFFEVDGRMFLAGVEYSGNVDVASLRDTLEHIVASVSVTRE